MMTVNTTTTKDLYTGDDTETVFSYTFRILDDDHIKVEIKNSAGTITEQTITTHYTVSGVGDTAGGAITFVTAPASTDTIIFTRDVPIKQDTDYQENDTFPAESHEEALDKLTMIAQQIDEATERTVKTDASVIGFDGTLPTPSANSAIGFDGSGTGLAIITALETGDLVIGGSQVNGVMTFTTATSIGSEDNLTFDGSTLALTGAATVSSTLSVTGVMDVASDIVHAGDTNNKIGFTTDTQTFTTGGSSRMDITDLGVRLGATGARVTAVLDEDDLVTDSATALATQQSIKAYVDAAAPTGVVVQQVRVTSTSVATTTSTIPSDTSVPQNTEGSEYFTLAITPTSATNVLIIEVHLAYCGHNGGNEFVAALFQDATASALTADIIAMTNTYSRMPLDMKYIMVSGTTSETTFKVRYGDAVGGTAYVGDADFGGLAQSSIVITEITV